MHNVHVPNQFNSGIQNLGGVPSQTQCLISPLDGQQKQQQSPYKATTALRQWRKHSSPVAIGQQQPVPQQQGPHVTSAPCQMMPQGGGVASVARVAPQMHYHHQQQQQQQQQPYSQLSNSYHHHHQVHHQVVPPPPPPPVRYSEIVEVSPPQVNKIAPPPKDVEMMLGHWTGWGQHHGGSEHLGYAPMPPSHHPQRAYGPNGGGGGGHGSVLHTPSQRSSSAQTSFNAEANPYLAQLHKINPRVAQSIINDSFLDQSRLFNAHVYPPMYNGHKTTPYPTPYYAPPKPQSASPTTSYKYNAHVEQPTRNISPRTAPMVYQNYHTPQTSKQPPPPPPPYYEYSQHYQHRSNTAKVHVFAPPPPQTSYYGPTRSHVGGQTNLLHSYGGSRRVVEDEGKDDGGGNINLKTFLESWNEEDERAVNEGAKTGGGGKGTELYVYDSTDISNDAIGQYLHIQQVDKLPENIRGYIPTPEETPKTVIKEVHNQAPFKEVVTKECKETGTTLHVEETPEKEEKMAVTEKESNAPRDDDVVEVKEDDGQETSNAEDDLQIEKVQINNREALKINQNNIMLQIGDDMCLEIDVNSDGEKVITVKTCQGAWQLSEVSGETAAATVEEEATSSEMETDVLNIQDWVCEEEVSSQQPEDTESTAEMIQENKIESSAKTRGKAKKRLQMKRWLKAKSTKQRVLQLQKRRTAKRKVKELVLCEEKVDAEGGTLNNNNDDELCNHNEMEDNKLTELPSVYLLRLDEIVQLNAVDVMIGEKLREIEEIEMKSLKCLRNSPLKMHQEESKKVQVETKVQEEEEEEEEEEKEEEDIEETKVQEERKLPEFKSTEKNKCDATMQKRRLSLEEYNYRKRLDLQQQQQQQQQQLHQTLTNDLLNVKSMSRTKTIPLETIPLSLPLIPVRSKDEDENYYKDNVRQLHETRDIVRRFLNKECLSQSELLKVQEIIKFKSLLTQKKEEEEELVVDCATETIPEYLGIKKRKRRRFRNLYSDEDEEELSVPSVPETSSLCRDPRLLYGKRSISTSLMEEEQKKEIPTIIIKKNGSAYSSSVKP